MSESELLDEELSHRRTAQGENRLPPAAAVMVAAAAYSLLPESLLFAPRFVIPVVELALLVALLATNPRRMIRQTRWSRGASVALVAVIISANLVALGILVASLTKSSTAGSRLLIAAMQVWMTNVIGFGLLY